MQTNQLALRSGWLLRRAVASTTDTERPNAGAALHPDIRTAALTELVAAAGSVVLARGHRIDAHQSRVLGNTGSRERPRRGTLMACGGTDDHARFHRLHFGWRSCGVSAALSNAFHWSRP